MFWFLVGGGIGGAFWGLMVALIIKWARKEQKLPMWPIVTGLLLGMLSGLLALR